MTDRVDDPTLRSLSDALWRASREAEIVASNVANIDTPGYRALEVRFRESLRGLGVEGLKQTDPRHVGTTGAADRPQPIVGEAPWTRMRPDGNTVDIDREMTRLAKAQGRVTTAAQLVRKRFALLRYAATDGRG